MGYTASLKLAPSERLYDFAMIFGLLVLQFIMSLSVVW